MIELTGACGSVDFPQIMEMTRVELGIPEYVLEANGFMLEPMSMNWIPMWVYKCRYSSGLTLYLEND